MDLSRLTPNFQSENLLLEFGLSRMIDIYQLFYGKEGGRITAIVSKIVEYILVTGSTYVVNYIVRSVDGRFKPGTVVHDPGCIRYLCFNITQEEDYKFYIESNESFSAIECHQISRVRHRDTDASLNGVERSSFASINSSLHWMVGYYVVSLMFSSAKSPTTVDAGFSSV